MGLLETLSDFFQTNSNMSDFDIDFGHFLSQFHTGRTFDFTNKIEVLARDQF